MSKDIIGIYCHLAETTKLFSRLVVRVIASAQCCCYKCVRIICVSETVFSIKYHHVLFKIVLYMVCRGYVYGKETDLGGKLQNNCYSLEISSVLGPKSDYYWQIL